MTSKIETKPRLVSGIRPTSFIHIGNYYGGVKGLAELQDQYDAYYFIADLHSLTTHPKSNELKANTISIARSYLAAGLDPNRCTLYVQSQIAEEICQLHTYLSMVMPLGELLRCPTFKEKAKKHPDNVNYGLVGYPVLMAADILIHKGEVVPVGEDQYVHLEIARTIVRRFHSIYETNIFPEPQGLLENPARIPSLNGQGKMSKSDANDTYLSMEDDKEEIIRKIRKAYSDPLRVFKKDPGHPDRQGCNVYHLHSYFTPEEKLEEIQQGCLSAELGCVDCKMILAESVLEIIEPFQERMRQFTDQNVLDILHEGAQRAREDARKVIAEVREMIGLHMI